MSKNTVDQPWPLRISAAWRTSVQAIIETGRLLNEAKAKMEPVDFRKMIEGELPFGERTAERLMAIGSCKRLATHVSVMPASWGTLYQITRLTAFQFKAALKAGIIHPDMQRKDIERQEPIARPVEGGEPHTVNVRVTEQPPVTRFVTVQVVHKTQQIVAPFYRTKDEGKGEAPTEPAPAPLSAAEAAEAAEDRAYRLANAIRLHVLPLFDGDDAAMWQAVEAMLDAYRAEQEGDAVPADGDNVVGFPSRH